VHGLINAAEIDLPLTRDVNPIVRVHRKRRSRRLPGGESSSSSSSCLMYLLLHADTTYARVANCNTSVWMYATRNTSNRRALGTRNPSLARRCNFGMSYCLADVL